MTLEPVFGFVERLWKAEFMRFAAIGTAAFVVDSAVLYAALALGLGLYWGRAVSYLVAATFTWYGNRRITFATHARGARAVTAEWIRFLLANLVGGAVNYTTYAMLVSLLPLVRAYPVLGVAAGSIAGLGVNFTLSKLLVFRASRSAD
jgi:putative flippase GtrA